MTFVGALTKLSWCLATIVYHRKNVTRLFGLLAHQQVLIVVNLFALKK
jgi:hypothetical protein